MKKITIKTLAAAMLVVGLILLNSCKKSNTTTTSTPASLPTVSTGLAISVTSTSAVYGGTVTADASGATITSSGICYSTTNQLPDLTSSVTISGSGVGSFTCTLTGLNLFSTYYIRAYATNSAGTAYGNVIQFQLGIGAPYQGGIIAYVFQPADPGYNAGTPHGLIAAPTDQSINATWYNGTYTATGATGTTLGTGITNTSNIIAVQSAGSYAASLCHALTLGGYTDWYLPSKDELNTLYTNRIIIGGFSSVGYWSSSEVDINDAFIQNFSSGSQISFNKNNTSNATRAVRSF